jgi:formylglycine-generating enzyme
MKSFLFPIITLILLTACQKDNPDMILVEGGQFKNKRSSYLNSKNEVNDFYIGKYEVSQKEWQSVMGTNPSKFKGDNLPSERVSWYDCIEFCNKKSHKEGLDVYYQIENNRKDTYNNDDRDSLKWLITINEKANGYRLPTVEEWEYAASGGSLSESYAYSGSNDVNTVAWYYVNSGDKILNGFWNWSQIKANNNKTQPIGSKLPNELGIYNMSGNVKEWCWDWVKREGEPVNERSWRGGGWAGADFCTEIAYHDSYVGISRAEDQGLRLARNK